MTYIYLEYITGYIAYKVYKTLLCGYCENYNYIFITYNRKISTSFYLLAESFLEYRWNTHTLRYLWRSWDERLGWPRWLDTSGDNGAVHHDRRNSLLSFERW